MFWSAFKSCDVCQKYLTSLWCHNGTLRILNSENSPQRAEVFPALSVSENYDHIWWFRQYMVVSWNRGTPKSSIWLGFSSINQPIWGAPILGNLHIKELVSTQNDDFMAISWEDVVSIWKSKEVVTATWINMGVIKSSKYRQLKNNYCHCELHEGIQAGL